MKRFIYISRITGAVFLSLLILFSPILILAGVIVSVPGQYDNYFSGALDEKYERLTSIEEDKIVVVGGSSVAFGLESELLEEYTGMPVVNFGLYAALGTKIMLDLSRDGISEGDIVILAPELAAQTLSLYFNAKEAWHAIDGNLAMFSSIPFENRFSMLGAAFEYAANKLRQNISGKDDPAGVYNGNNFDEHGDLVYVRENNTMYGYHIDDNMINLSPEIVDEDFIKYLNEYIDFCERKGADVYFAYCPMNELAIVEGSDADAFEDYLKEKIDCPFISNIGDYIYEAGYFYDTNYHLNDSGVIAHTVNLTKDILLELGIPRRVTVDVPKAPELPGADIRYFGEDENTKYFEFAQNDDGTYKIIGLSDLGKTQKRLTVPLGYNEYKVTIIGEGAFIGGAVETLILTEETNICVISDGAFSGAGRLSALVIDVMLSEKILPPASFSGTSAGFTVYVPDGSNFTTDYNWAHRNLKFRDIADAPAE